MAIELLPAVEKGARLSDDGVYRYSLVRRWDASRPPVVIVMLNPSTADASVDDPTIRRCMGFARSWGRGGIYVVNLFALRATDPKALALHPDPVGPSNRGVLTGTIQRNGLLVAAWGAHPFAKSQAQWLAAGVRSLGKTLHSLGTTKAGDPRHPLYVRADQALTPWPVGGVSDTASSYAPDRPESDHNVAESAEAMQW